jgi:mRNA interferase MazF
MPYDRGQVVLVLFPNSSLRTAKRRPALVVQRSGLNSGLAQTIVEMITSNMVRAGHSSRIEVLRASDAGQRMGLLTNSVIMTDNVATVMDTEIDRGIGFCDDMSAIDAALRFTLEL